MVNHYVYVIRENRVSKKAPVKIGVAVDVSERIAELQIGNPRELVEVMKFGPMTREAAYELEDFYHRRFRKQCIRGEWFSGYILKWITAKPVYRERTPHESPLFGNRSLSGAA